MRRTGGTAERARADRTAGWTPARTWAPDGGERRTAAARGPTARREHAALARDGTRRLADARATGSMRAPDRDAPRRRAATATLPPRDGCACDTGGGSSFGGSALGLSLFGLVIGVRRRRAFTAERRAPSGSPPCALLVLAWAARAEAAYSYRMAITIDRTRIGTSSGATTLSNYPLLLDITSANLKSIGQRRPCHERQRLRHQLPGRRHDHLRRPVDLHLQLRDRELHLHRSSGRVIAWVNIPVLKTTANTANTVIYVKYGDATVTTPTQNQNGTWNSNFKGVWHLNQAASPQTDSTSTPSNASHNGAPAPATATGLIGSGVSMSSTTGTAYLDYRATKFNWTSSDTFTYQGWFKTTDGYGPLFSQRDNGAGNPVIDITVGYNGGTTNTSNMSVLVRDDTGSELRARSTARRPSTTTSGTTSRSRVPAARSRLYVDGVSIGTGTGRGRRGNITTGAAGNYQNIGREGNWVPTSYGTVDQQYLAGDLRRVPHLEHRPRRATGSSPTTTRRATPASTYALGTEAAATCGNGTKAGAEACDDGNIVSGDGCSGSCTVESGYTCTGTMPSVCSTVCGDGIVAGPRAATTAAPRSGDGCSATCTVETGYHCSGVAQRLHASRCSTTTRRSPSIGRRSEPSRRPRRSTNYPVLFSVTDPSLRAIANGGHVRNANGYDIIFRGLDTVDLRRPFGVHARPPDREVRADDRQLVAWVNIPGLKSRTNAAEHADPDHVRQPAISTSHRAGHARPGTRASPASGT